MKVSEEIFEFIKDKYPQAKAFFSILKRHGFLRLRCGSRDLGTFNMPIRIRMQLWRATMRI